MDQPRFIEPAGKIVGLAPVPLVPSVQVLHGGQPISLPAVTGAVGQDEVVGQVQRIPAPGDEVVHRSRFPELPPAIEAPAFLDILQDLPIAGKIPSGSPKEELPQFGVGPQDGFGFSGSSRRKGLSGISAPADRIPPSSEEEAGATWLKN